jgi:pimeloyl-ACP methyl ester carboxylesterase
VLVEHTVTAPDGVPLHVLAGDASGQPVLLLHGGGRSVADWVDVAGRLAALGHRPIALDLRGHGATPVTPWSWRTALEDVGAVVDQLALDRPVVVGHSLGGMVAASWAAEHPECPLAVNVDGHGNPTRPGHFAGPGSERGLDLLALLAGWATGLDPHLRQVMVAIDELDLVALYGRSRCPLLVTRGERSMAEVLPEEVRPAWVAYERWVVRELVQVAAAHPAVELVRTPTGHDAHLEAPELLVSLIDQRSRPRSAG